jgi:hypothetical protein
MNDLQNLLDEFVRDPENPNNNLNLAKFYHSIDQTASAISYYTRTAERTEDKTLMYACLLAASDCFNSQGCRNNSVKGLIQSAIAVQPKRPEGYFLLSRFYEKEKNYHDSYLIASIGESVADFNLDILPIKVDYPGYYGILFEKAVSSWWCGLCDDSREYFLELKNKHWNKMDKIHRNSVMENLKLLKVGFDWGHAQENEWFKDTVEKEIFVDNVYQKFFEVENNDVVFDIGASAGPFTYSIKEKNPSKVYCFEPHSELFKNLTKNVESDKVVCINKAIGPVDGYFETSGLFNKDLRETSAEKNTQTAASVKFSTFIEKNNIEKIDFLKSDCEGSEYDVFNDENLSWIKKNVKKIAGEWHLTTPEQKEKFRHFRDTYLRDFPNHEVYSIDYVDIKWSVWDDWFIDHYCLINLYIDNRENNAFDWGALKENFWNYESIKKEFDPENVNYEKHFNVENNDIVVDIGASVGPFTNLILEKNPKKVICLEPHPELFKTLIKNTSNYKNVVCLNQGISPIDGDTIFDGLYNDDLDFKYRGDSLWKKTLSGTGITFKSLLLEQKIDKIDFLKTDCEGGEYDIFNDENLSWIKKNVKKIAGEWHLNTPDQKERFRHFRDTYLRDFPNHKIYFVDYYSNFNDITSQIWDDKIIENYGWINIYIDNRVQIQEKKWKNSILPTMEFTTSIDTKNGCVVDCVFCPQRTLQKAYKGERFLSLDNFKKAVDKMPQEIRVTFAGFTEPWLNPKTTEMLLYAHQEGHPISVFTTGIGMDIDDIERIKNIPYAGNPNGGFVLHLPDQERKAKHPITDRYIKVIEKFGEVHKEIQNFTLMCMGTVHESVRHIFPEASTYQMWSRAGNLLGESIMKPELLNRKDEYKSVYHGEQPMTCGCLEKLYHNIMLPNGDVSLCCMDYGLEHILGNLLEQEYEDVIPYDNTCFNLCKFCENAKKPL